MSADPQTTTLGDVFWFWAARSRVAKAKRYRERAADLLRRAELLEFEAEALQP